MTNRSHSVLRRFWSLNRDITFLNHGSFGACPKPILDLQSELRARMEAEPVQFLWRHFDEQLKDAREELATFLDARPEDLVFVHNTTAAVNAVVRSLRWRAGDEILTTNHAYNACRNVLVEAARRAGANVVVANVPFPLRRPDEIIEAIIGGVTKRTRLALIDHVTSHSALIFPIERIVRELDARGIDTLVDGAHAPGMVPIALRRLRPAYYTGNLHKWVCAPKGAAFLWVREELQNAVQPAIISHGNNRARPGFTLFQDRFDWPGTFDPTAWLCVGAAIRWMGDLLPGGWKAVRAQNRALAAGARRLLCERLKVAAPCPVGMLGSMATIPLPSHFQRASRRGKIDPEQLRLYDQFQIEVPFVWLGEPLGRYFRISAQLYNAPRDYEALADALDALIANSSKGERTGARR